VAEAVNASATNASWSAANRFATAAIVVRMKRPVVANRSPRRATEMRSACQTVAIWVKSRIVVAPRPESVAASA